MLGASDEGKTQLPKARVFDMHYGAKVRERIIIQTLYDFPRSFPCRFFSHVKEGLYQAILFFWERGKSYNFCMMPSKIYGNLYDFHSSLYTLVNIIQSLNDGNTFVCVTFSFDSIISLHAKFLGHTGHVKKYHKILPMYKFAQS